MLSIDADSFHSDEAIAQMSQGIPLSDAQRAPWVERIHSQLCQHQSANKSSALAYSGLKQHHREVIFSAYENTAGVLLSADQKLITGRLAQRTDHFMSPHLRSSQIAEMDPFGTEIQLLRLDTADSVEQLLVQFDQFMSLLK